MPTAPAHVLLALAAGRAALGRGWTGACVAAAVAVLPDADVLLDRPVPFVGYWEWFRDARTPGALGVELGLLGPPFVALLAWGLVGRRAVRVATATVAAVPTLAAWWAYFS
ncbi:MAG: hypothetical protein HY722_00200 [Planctomycetes bacterium]|nr:hypothetical protein [Planctomycetota bacterium]